MKDDVTPKTKRDEARKSLSQVNYMVSLNPGVYRPADDARIVRSLSIMRSERDTLKRENAHLRETLARHQALQDSAYSRGYEDAMRHVREEAERGKAKR